MYYCVLEPITIVEDKSGSNLNVVTRLVQFGRLRMEICILDKSWATSIFWQKQYRIWIQSSTETEWFCLVHLLLVERNPVHAWEPLVATYVLDSILQIAIAFGEVNLEQVAQKILDVGAKMWWKTNLKQANFTAILNMKKIHRNIQN